MYSFSSQFTYLQTNHFVYIEHPYRFQWRLPPQTEVNEGGRFEFEVEVEEEEAEVRWFSDDVEIQPEKSRQDHNALSI